MIHDSDSTNTELAPPLKLTKTTNRRTTGTTTTRKNTRRRTDIEAIVKQIKPSYSVPTTNVPVATGAFEIEPNGTILNFRPYDANGIANDELAGLNLFEDVIRIASERDADYFSNCVENGEAYRTSRHLLHGRDLSLILLYHANTGTYWGFLGPA